MKEMMAEPSPPLIPEHVQALLQPLSPQEPAGAAMRFDPLFTAIRLEREEDDPTLPMRQWERPLKVADWPSIERRCEEFLKTRSKDLQIAAWTLEAWFRQREINGLFDGLTLVSGLIERYWDHVHPIIDEDGDSDARVAAFEWLNEEVPVWLRTRVVLGRFPGHQPAVFTVADWVALSAPEVPKEVPVSDRKRNKGPVVEVLPPVTREMVLDDVRAGSWQRVVSQLQDCRRSLHQAQHIDRVLKDRLDVQAPSLAKMTRELETLERSLKQVLESAELPHLQTPRPIIQEPAVAETTPQTPDVTPVVIEPPDLPAGGGHTRGSWSTRAEAYSTLEAIADFLARTEPHSPTPYLIRRAVNWGKMSLPELMAEIQREEGDLNKLVNLLNVGYRDE